MWVSTGSESHRRNLFCYPRTHRKCPPGSCPLLRPVLQVRDGSLGSFRQWTPRARCSRRERFAGAGHVGGERCAIRWGRARVRQTFGACTRRPAHRQRVHLPVWSPPASRPGVGRAGSRRPRRSRRQLGNRATDRPRTAPLRAPEGSLTQPPGGVAGVEGHTNSSFRNGKVPLYLPAGAAGRSCATDRATGIMGKPEPNRIRFFSSEKAAFLVSVASAPFDPQ